ncbi:MAG: hypothetical protein DRO98_07915 [Archaeoglobales archaeon]|nr:MAG: hypothetical protein DRO98_07915 [Archaeoglobales archaeon]
MAHDDTLHRFFKLLKTAILKMKAILRFKPAKSRDQTTRTKENGWNTKNPGRRKPRLRRKTFTRRCANS